MAKSKKTSVIVQFTDENQSQIQSFIGWIPNMKEITTDDPLWKEFYDQLDEMTQKVLPEPV